MANVARAELETLLRARKLDVTLTSAAAWRHAPADCLAPTAMPALDGALGGGLRRGHLSEIVGARSAGRTTVLVQVVAAATARGEIAALVDVHDRFDPESAAAAGLDLSRLLWIRERGDATRAVKAMNLVLQAGGFGLVAIDLADIPAAVLTRLPLTTWLRVQRIVEGSDTACVLIVPEPLARSAGGLTLILEGTTRWDGRADRSRRLAGRDITVRVLSPRRRVDGDVTVGAVVFDSH